jgi:hypothetical protein
MYRRSSIPGSGSAPSDGCPYRRPFSESFADCPAYEPELFTPSNLQDVPLGPTWTCRNLAVGQHKQQPGRLYAQCLVGDAETRRAAFFRKLRGPRVA